MLPETKPSNCRNVLRDSGKPYPRSGCAVCKNGGLMGCPYKKEINGPDFEDGPEFEGYALRAGVKQEPYAYIDDKNRLVKISGHVYFDGGFVDANSEIPDNWKTLVLVEKA